MHLYIYLFFFLGRGTFKYRIRNALGHNVLLLLLLRRPGVYLLRSRTKGWSDPTYKTRLPSKYGARSTARAQSAAYNIIYFRRLSCIQIVSSRQFEFLLRDIIEGIFATRPLVHSWRKIKEHNLKHIYIHTYNIYGIWLDDILTDATNCLLHKLVLYIIFLLFLKHIY